MHGGTNPGGPFGNKKALKTGRYESILLDVLDDDEQALFAETTVDPIAGLDEEIALLTVRERRMLQRIAGLKKAGEMTLVEESTKVLGDQAPAMDPDASCFSDRFASELSTDELDDLTAEPATAVLETKRKHVGTLGQIQTIEADLTAVQAAKARCLEAKHRMLTKDAERAADTPAAGADSPLVVLPARSDDWRALLDDDTPDGGLEA